MKTKTKQNKTKIKTQKPKPDNKKCIASVGLKKFLKHGFIQHQFKVEPIKTLM